MFLNNQTFYYAMSLKDGFGNPVVGHVIEIGNYTAKLVVLGENCELHPNSTTQKLSNITGYANFTNLYLTAKNGANCELKSALMNDSLVSPALCNSTLNGCPSGFSIETGTEFDNCVKSKYPLVIEIVKRRYM